MAHRSWAAILPLWQQNIRKQYYFFVNVLAKLKAINTKLITPTPIAQNELT